MTLLLTNEEMAELLTMETTLTATEQSQRDLLQGQSVNGPRVDTLAAAGRRDIDATYSLKSMTGVWTEGGVAVLRLNSDLLFWPRVDGALRRDRLAPADGRRTSFLILFSLETAAPLLICTDGFISMMRTGAVNALGAKYLAPAGARTMALLGAGWHARGQLLGHCTVRPVTEVRVFSPNPRRREQFCQEMQPQVAARLTPVSTAEAAVAGVDLVVTSTNALEPVHRRSWAAPGVHYSALKIHEVDADFLTAMDRICLFSKQSGTLGALRAAAPAVSDALEPLPAWFRDRAAPGWQRAVELPDLVTGRVPGRLAAAETTLFVNNVGQGLQFAAVAKAVYDAAVARGAGTRLPTQWFTQVKGP